MQSTSLLTLGLFFSLLILVGCGGEGEEVEKEFRLSETPANELSPKGMGKDFIGDTLGISSPGTKVYSPDSSKVAWCEGKTLFVADADGKTQQALHTEVEDSSVFICFAPQWGTDGKSLTFKEGQRVPGDTTIQVVTVDITLGQSTEE
ncbi:MAG: hypothetical protein AB7H80_14550 [Candidatus Kapaibacterium sp.]